MIDIDDFKKVNDSHGHHIGDQVLKFVAKVLRTTIRTSDIALRFGGEEFVIFMPIEQLSGAANLAERLRLLVEQGDCNLPDVSISIGVHEMSNGETLEHALKQSDNRLYQAKHAGKNKVAVDNEPLQSIPS
jgi:diguanylate cyclase (GGDEF)-like protein